MPIEQSQIWNKEKQAVLALTDKLGTPVDRGIVETVTALRLLGLHTVGSCAGHISRSGSTGPFVLFKSPQTIELELLAKHIPPADPQYKQLRLRATKLNAKELPKLLPHLDAFYQNRHVPYAQRLIVQSFGPTAHRLTCQGSELMYSAGRNERRTLLRRHQLEMRTFTEFLKSIYFKDVC
jgi:hypothetical protein